MAGGAAVLWALSVPVDAEPSGQAVVPGQGWNSSERHLYYYTSQGTFLMPAAWLASLETPDGTRFMGRSNLERFGFVFHDDAAATRPYDWPIGIAIDTDPRNGGIDQAGLTCSACHTGQLEYRGRKFRVDGGQSNIDFRKFAVELNAAVVATGDSPQRKAQFLERVLDLGYPADRLEPDFELAHANAVKQPDMSLQFLDGMTPAGRGRLDAVTSIANAVFAQALAVPENIKPSTAPTSFPPLWDIWRFDWVQYNASARQPMARNIVEVLGTGPITIADPVTGELLPEPERWRSNIRVRNIHTIEKTLHHLEPPRWDEDIFGPIDRERARQGRALFAENCAACHGVKEIKGTSDPVEWHVPLVALDRIGTDSRQAVNFADNRFDAREIGGPVDMGVPEGLGLVLEQVKRQAYLDENVTPEEAAEFDGFGKRDGGSAFAPCGYKARPLVGIWATGPFLHNGAIPSIYDLLSETRPERFLLGSREFDPEQLGQAQNPGEGVIEVDTSLPGNGNSGHWFTDETERAGRIGPALTEDERYALIEYLKIADYSDYPREVIEKPGPAACAGDRDWAVKWTGP